MSGKENEDNTYNNKFDGNTKKTNNNTQDVNEKHNNKNEQVNDKQQQRKGMRRLSRIRLICIIMTRSEGRI